MATGQSFRPSGLGNHGGPSEKQVMDRSVGAADLIQLRRSSSTRSVLFNSPAESSRFSCLRQQAQTLRDTLRDTDARQSSWQLEKSKPLTTEPFGWVTAANEIGWEAAFLVAVSTLRPPSRIAADGRDTGMNDEHSLSFDRSQQEMHPLLSVRGVALSNLVSAQG